MKTNLKLITLLLAVSCVKAPSVEPNQQELGPDYTPMTFTAEAENVTRVVLGDDHTSLSWSKNDLINIFDGSSENLDPFVAKYGGPVTEFVGNVINPAGPFYALYPYQQSATLEDGVIYAEVPEIQYAVAGSVPSNAFLAVAKADENGKLFFKTVLGFIRFTLVDDNASEIESITLSGNDGEPLAGDVQIVFDENLVPNDSEVATDVCNQVTLVGDFQNREDYIFAVREADFSKGMTLSVSYKDGSKRYISSSSSPVDASDNVVNFTSSKVLNVSEVRAVEMSENEPDDRFVAWLHGYDLEIAGDTYNKYNISDYSLVKSLDFTTYINDAVNRVIFIDSQSPNLSGVSKPCDISGTAKVNGNLLLVGRYADKKNEFKPSVNISLMSGNLIMFGLDIDLVSCKTADDKRYFLVHENSNVLDIGKLYVSDCCVKSLYCFYYNDSANAIVKDIRILNSDFELDINESNNTTWLFNFKKTGSLHRIEEVTIDNNILFFQKLTSTCRLLETPKEGYASDKEWNTRISVCGNTIYNLHTPVGFVRFYKVSALKMRKNIIYTVPEYKPSASATGWNGNMFSLFSSHDSNLIDYGDNPVYCLSEFVTWNIARTADSKYIHNPNTVEKITTDPLATIDFATCTFTPIPAYASYGAQR